MKRGSKTIFTCHTQLKFMTLALVVPNV